MKYQTILFDLDGTLTDPGEGITRSVAYALESFGIHVPDRKVLYPFIGPPLLDSFMEFYGFSEKDARQAIEKYREYFGKQGIFENELYSGVPEALEELKKAGGRLVLATSKPEPYAKEILEHFHLMGYFDFVSGSQLDGTRSKKEEVIAYALGHCGKGAEDKALMVGDRKHDVQGALENGLPCAGVLYGYGSREELEQAGAQWILETPAQLSQLARL